MPGVSNSNEYDLPVASCPESNFPSGCMLTPPPSWLTVPDVTVCTPGSIWCHVTVEPAVTVRFAGLYAISFRFTVSPIAVAAVVGLDAFVDREVPDDFAPLDPHAVSAITIATTASAATAMRSGLPTNL